MLRFNLLRSSSFAVAVFLTIATVLCAHDPGLSTAAARWTPEGLELKAGFSLVDARALLAPSDTTAAIGKSGPAVVEANEAAMAAVAPTLWTVTADGASVPVQRMAVELLPGDNVSFVTVFRVPTASPKIEVEARRLSSLPPGHRQFFYVQNGDGAPVVKKLLSANDRRVAFSAPRTETETAPASAMPTFAGFVRLGIEHIWTGYDHLLFLFGLLVVCRSFRSVVTIISCFTIAHSTTLALATLNLVQLPTRITEPAIAASIVFVGLENLWRRGQEPRSRWAVTFAFGLIHGFGFASVLRDLGVGVGGHGILVPLFSFNLGVEIGQVAIAAIALPLLWRLRRVEAFVPRLMPALSVVVALAGGYWFTERLFWG